MPRRGRTNADHDPDRAIAQSGDIGGVAADLPDPRGPGSTPGCRRCGSTSPASREWAGPAPDPAACPPSRWPPRTASCPPRRPRCDRPGRPPPCRPTPRRAAAWRRAARGRPGCGPGRGGGRPDSARSERRRCPARGRLAGDRVDYGGRVVAVDVQVLVLGRVVGTLRELPRGSYGTGDTSRRSSPRPSAVAGGSAALTGALLIPAPRWPVAVVRRRSPRERTPGMRLHRYVALIHSAYSLYR